MNSTHEFLEAFRASRRRHGLGQQTPWNPRYGGKRKRSAYCGAWTRTENSKESVVAAIEMKWTQCGKCDLIHMVLRRFHFECPICGFPLRNLLPVETLATLWMCRPGS